MNEKPQEVYSLILVHIDEPVETTVDNFKTQELCMEKFKQWLLEDKSNPYWGDTVLMHGNACYEYTHQNKRTFVVMKKSYVWNSVD